MRRMLLAVLVVASLAAASTASAAAVVAKAGVTVLTGACSDDDDSGVLTAPSATATAACPSGAAEARVDLTTASAGVFASADSTPLATTISTAESEFLDRLHFQVPPALAGQPFPLGILFEIDGAMGPAAAPYFGTLLNARCVLVDVDSSQVFDGLAVETSPFTGTRSFPGVLSVTPPSYTVNVSMHMFAPGVIEDTVDFLASGRLYLSVPPAVTYESDSGVFFAPEPGASAMAGAAAATLAAVGARGRGPRAGAGRRAQAVRARSSSPRSPESSAP